MVKSVFAFSAVLAATFSSFILQTSAQDRAFTSSYPAYPKVSSSYHSKVEEIKWVDCNTNIPKAFAEQNGLKSNQQWPKGTPLPKSISCGRLDVPMDYSKPISNDNKITVGFTKVAANVTKSKGLIFFNPGGPGEEAQSWGWTTALARDPAFKLKPSADQFLGLGEYDTVFYDPRGTGDSNQLKCDPKITASALPRILPNESYYNALKDQNKALAESCIQLSTPKGVVGFMGSEDSVNDWESLRIALNYDKVSWIGVSYGTYFGAEYAYQFPDRMDRFVLDAVAAHGLADVDKVQMDLNTMNNLLERIDAWCMANTTCPFHSKEKGTIPTAFKNVSDIAPDKYDQLLRDQFSLNTQGVVKFAAFTEFLEQFVQAAKEGFKDDEDDSSDSSSASTPMTQEQINSWSFQPTICKDEVVDDPSFDGFMKIMKETTGEDPDKLIYQSGNFKNKMNCIGWPLPGRPKGRLPNQKPFMIATSDFDSNTPTEMATFIRQDNPNAVLVVRHGDSHGTFNLPNQPAQDLEIDYLLSGKLPTATDKKLVTVVSPGEKRPTIPDPYTVPVGTLGGDTDGVDSGSSKTSDETQDSADEGNLLSLSSSKDADDDNDHDQDDDDDDDDSIKGIWHDNSKLHKVIIGLGILSGALFILLIGTLIALIGSRRTVKRHLRSTGGTNSRAFEPHNPQFVQVQYPNDNNDRTVLLGSDSAKGYYGPVSGRDERGV